MQLFANMCYLHKCIKKCVLVVFLKNRLMVIFACFWCNFFATRTGSQLKEKLAFPMSAYSSSSVYANRGDKDRVGLYSDWGEDI